MSPDGARRTADEDSSKYHQPGTNNIIANAACNAAQPAPFSD
jgi:hypothetical protein